MGHLGKQTIKYKTPPVITCAYSAAGPKEVAGPMGKYFDHPLQDELLGQDSWEKAEAKEGEKVEDLPLVEKISATTVNTEDFTFAIYGVKDSADAVYAAQDPKVDTDDFKFAAIADVYEVEIPEEFAEVAEKPSAEEQCGNPS